MIFHIELVKDQSFDKCLSQFNKRQSSFGSKKI